MTRTAWAGIAVILGGVLVLALGIWLWLRGRRLTAQTVGVVTAMEERGSGEFPVVTFTPTGVTGGPSGPIQFHSNLSIGHKVGDAVEVRYEPADPSHASIAPAVLFRLSSLAMIGGGFLGASIGVLLLAVLAPAVEARDRAVERFFAAARAGDAQKLAAVSARNARLDQAMLFAEGKRSRSVRTGSSAMNFDDSCVEVILEPHEVRLLTKLLVEKGKWRVQRVAANDEECERRIE